MNREQPITMPSFTIYQADEGEQRQEAFPWLPEGSQPVEEEDKQKRLIEAKIRRLAEALEQVQGTVEEYIKNYINPLFKLFHKYSFLNSLIIFINKPNATLVRGRRGWEEFGRRPKEDARAIMIYVPVYFRTDKDGNPIDPPRLGFIMKPVYDISDTEEIEDEKLSERAKKNKEKLNEILSGKNGPKWFSEEKLPEAEKRLMDYCRKNGITVEYVEHLEAGTRGVAIRQNGISKIELLKGSGIATFIHELAHVLLHHMRRIGDFVLEEKTRKLKELEAEAVAYIVCSHFGINTLVSSSNYMAFHKIKPNELKNSLQDIYECSREIIKAIEGEKAKKQATQHVEDENQLILPFMANVRAL